jgi:hypothetical protein
VSLRKLFLLLFVFISLTFFLNAEKRRPPVPLEELQNPKSPSYVPIPYPQTREEILEDLKYVIKKFFGPRKGLKSVGENFGSKILPKLYEEDSGFYVGNIVTAENKTLSREKKYFIIEIFDNSNNVVARVSLKDSGLFAGAGFGSEKIKINPLKTKQEVREFLLSQPTLKLTDTEIESIDYEHVYARGCHPAYPFIKIKTQTKTYYMNSKNEIYEVKKIEKHYSSKFRYNPDLFYKYSLIIEDKINNEFIYLNKV